MVAQLVALLLVALAPLVLATTSTEPSFAALPGISPEFSIASFNATKQWVMTVATGNARTGTLFPVTCRDNSLPPNSCTNPALTQDSGDFVQITYKLNATRGPSGSLATFRNLTPTGIRFMGCYSLPSAVDRAWRKKNKPYPRLSTNCPLESDLIPFNGTAAAPSLAENTGVAFIDMDKQDEVATASMFTMLWLYCGDEVCGFESTEAGPLIYTTEVKMGITPGMRAAAIVLSIFSPLLFIAYYIADSRHYKKTGKPLRFGA